MFSRTVKISTTDRAVAGEQDAGVTRAMYGSFHIVTRGRDGVLAADEKTEGGVDGSVIAVIGENAGGTDGSKWGPLAAIGSGDVSLSLDGDGGLTDMRLAQIKR